MRPADQSRAITDTLFGCWVIAVAIVCAMLICNARPAAQLPGSSPGAGQPRTVDMARLRQRIDQRQLSRHPARYARPSGPSDRDKATGGVEPLRFQLRQ